MLRSIFELCSAAVASPSFKAPPLLRALLREEMALFNDRSVDDNQVLSISYEGAAPATQVDLWVHDPAIGALVLDWDLSPDSHHLSRWYTESSRELFDHGKSTLISDDALLLRSSLHKKNDDSEHFLLLGDRIANEDAKWGNTTPLFGEISFINGYWDWLEDVLARNKDVLSTAKMYDAVFASLFTYVRNTNLIRSFCELWYPSTNSLHVPIGEVSISLWDLRLTGGLSIDGIFYDEAVPSARELTSVDKKDVPLLPSSCKYLFLAYRKIYCASKTSNITTHDWVKFWFKETSRYKEPAPPPPLGFRRKGQWEFVVNPFPPIFPFPTQVSNPISSFLQAADFRLLLHGDFAICLRPRFVHRESQTTTNHHAPPQTVDNCRAFAFWTKYYKTSRPVRAFDFRQVRASIEPLSGDAQEIDETYQVLESLEWSAAISWISFFSALVPIVVDFGSSFRYYDSYFLCTSTKFTCGARMVRLGGEKKAKHFSSQEARDLLKNIMPSTLSPLALTKPKQGIVTDHGKHSDSWNDYIISLRSSYLTLRRGNEHIVEPYSPYLFARQFRFCQDIPGKLREELSTGTLEAIYQLWESCTRLNTRAEFMIPSHSFEGLATKEYAEWWEKSSSSFCKYKPACAKPDSSPAAPRGKNLIKISITKSKLASEVTQPLSKPKEKEVTKAVTKEAAVVIAVRPKTPLSIPASKPKPTVTNTSEPTSGRKRATVVLSEGSSYDQGERHWKRGKKKATDSDSQLKEKVTVSDLAKLDFNLHGVVDNLPDTSNHLELGNQFASDEREGSVDGPDPFDLALRSKHNFVSGAIHLPSTSKPLTLGRATPSTVTAFDTGSVINRGRLLATKIYDSNIKSILGKTPFEKLTSLKPKLQVIYAEFSKLELDYSPLQTQVEKYIQNATNYASMRSNFASGMTSKAKERRLADVDTKRGQLMEELEQLDLEAKRLRESLEGIDAQRAQKQHVVSALQAEQANIEATEVMEPADMEVANNLEQLLKSELEEIQNLAWLD
ncbi:hypothetical protein RHGRI_026389 [Rhododendron griersonianum]|uniref:Aminotransferase-like plant mobile domain-containing protein n=1 Tax=Rhododendron griersonianum TaxID=479676 RepID=A0AAV6ISI7_9ERIC|nr:hypothetical protein RHGRI_026389 [Rhododendron griersonianum]